MKQTLQLQQPIKINGVERTELAYDAMEITADMYLSASSKSVDTTVPGLQLRENNYGFHLLLGMYAVIAVNPDIALEDLQRIKGMDLLQIANIGLFFTLGKLDKSQAEILGDASDLTANDTTQAPLQLKKNV